MWITISASFLGGLACAFFIKQWQQRRLIQLAKAQADDIISNGQEIADEYKERAERKAKEYRDQIEEQYDEEIKDVEFRIEGLEIALDEKRSRLEERVRARRDIHNKKRDLHDKHGQLVKHKQQKYQEKLIQRADLKQSYASSISTTLDIDAEEIKNEIKSELERDTEVCANKLVTHTEERAQRDAERDAKRIIHIAINRFARPYCPERGIGYVYLTNEAVRQKVLGSDRSNLALIEQACGVDLIYNEEMHSLSVSGFDPVRRELARACLEKLCSEKNINKERIEQIVSKTKRNLFKKIRRDGNKQAQTLKLRNLHPEIRNMMGALRFRYSFAQNQYFHCGEVGFLCGLLASEIGDDIWEARRAGMLHDLGKAMDHSIDGGHAVIGADFIERHEEKPHIVHAVRAHHFDEQPSTDLAYLVIAADAISGARPGARRSTADSYMQKMGQLEMIGNGFEGVQSTYILSAGREVRIHVDSKRLDDMAALVLSKKIASKIEEECNYPGLIKVTVVRETQSVQVAK